MRIARNAAISLVATIAASATFVGTASATSPKLDLNQGGGHSSLAPGDFFQATQEEHNGSKFAVFFTGGATVECRNENDHNGFSGTVLSNDKGTDKVSLTSGGFEFGEACTEAAGGGSAFVEPIDFPWTLSIRHTGVLVVKGSPKVGFEITFSSGAECTYEKAVLKGEAIPTPAAEAQQLLNIAFTNQTFQLNAAASKGGAACPKTDSLSMELETSGESGQIYDVIR